MFDSFETGNKLTSFFVFLFLAVLLASAAQIFLKFSTTNDLWALPSLPMFNLYFFAAAALYFASMLFYTASLKVLPVTFAYPSMALSYVIVAIASHVIWKTPFGALDFLALLLIFIALGLIAYSNSSLIDIQP